MGKTTKNFEREFHGKLSDFKDNDEARFEGKHLKAYLKGLEKFTYGYHHQLNPFTNQMETVPTWHDVKQSVIDLNQQNEPTGNNTEVSGQPGVSN